MLTNLQMKSSRFGHVFGYMYICMYIHILCIWWMWLKGGTYYAPLPYLNCIAMAPGKLITKNSSICLDRYRSSSATAAKCRAIFKLLLLRQLAGKIVKWARKKGWLINSPAFCSTSAICCSESVTPFLALLLWHWSHCSLCFLAISRIIKWNETIM